jgi:hypothetical protein
MKCLFQTAFSGQLVNNPRDHFSPRTKSRGFVLTFGKTAMSCVFEVLR